MINGNLVGFGMFIAAAAWIAIGSLVLKLPDAPVMIAAGGLLILIDSVLRIVRAKHEGWYWRKEYGGFLFFAPVWIFGIAVIVINVINMFVNKK